LISAFDFFPSALAGAFLPALSRLGIGDNRRFIEIFKSYYKYALIIGSGIAALLGGLADDLLPFIFGTAFSAGASTLVILSACLLLTFVNWSFSSAVIALNKEKQMLVIFVIGTAANIGLNLFLIPRFQQVGAAWATLASQVLLLSLQLRAVGEPFLSGLGLIGLSVRPVIAGLVTFWMALFISDLNGSVIWKLFLSGMGFLLLLKLTGTLSYRELVEIKSVFRPARPSSKDAT
jgi:O-antigen/teichoic acid export membrane protein